MATNKGKTCTLQASSAHPLSRFINWLPLWLGLGVLGYFVLPFEPPFWVPPAGILVVLAALMLCWKTEGIWLKQLLLVALVAVIGFGAAVWQTGRVGTPFLARPYFVVPMEATVADIEPKGKRHSMILKDLKAPTIPSEQLPRRVKVSASLKGVEVQEGDRISLRATLIPPSPPVLEGAFDFARFFYFRSIGAVGYAMPPVKLLSPHHSGGWNEALLHGIAEYRQSLQQKLLKHMTQPASGIAVAFVTGSMDSVTASANQALRNSSLSHMLSISGMHMVIVCGFIFFAVRLILVLIPNLYTYIDPKRWAATTALLAGGFYLLMADSPVPAVRAYVMIAVFLSAILFDREADALRSLALAAAGILLLQPSALLEPSFQLSFAATLALVLAFRAAEPWYHREGMSGKGIGRQLLAYVAASGFSSLVAGTATMPFIIYHFNQFVIYGVLANILAAPLLSFIITPALVFVLIVPEAWISWFAMVATWGLETLVKIGEWVSSLPLAAFYVPPVTGWQLVLFVAAAVLIRVLPRWWKLLPLPLALPLILQLFVVSSPDLLISRDARALAVRDGSRFILLSGTARHFTVSLWQQRLGMEFVEWKRMKEGRPAFIRCEEKECYLTLKNKTYFVGNVPPQECRGIDGFIEFTLKRERKKPGKRTYPPMNLHCPDVPVIIDFWKIVKEGPLAIDSGDPLQIHTACDDAPKRPWVFYCSRESSVKRKYPLDSKRFKTPSSPHK